MPLMLRLFFMILTIIGEFSYIVFALSLFHQRQDISFEKDGINWPVTKFSLSLKRERKIVPYNQISRCILGSEEKHFKNDDWNYFYLESKNYHMKYFSFGTDLNIEEIRTVLNEKNIGIEEKAYWDTVKLSNRGL